MENITDRFDSVEILVLVHIQVVKRVSLRRVSVTESEIDRDTKLDFAATKDVLEERMSLVEY